MNVNSNNNISFNGRCPQIKDAQWVARRVVSEHPHVSTSRVVVSINELKDKNTEMFCNFCKSKNRAFNVESQSKKESSLFKIFDWRGTLTNKIDELRGDWLYSVRNTNEFVEGLINQLKSEKFGNCAEDAMFAQSILKINGVENAYNAGLKVDGVCLDHCVCVFNKDGSVFDGNVTKDTIIIDPWLGGAADFASNMFEKYRSIGKKYFPSINENSKITFRNISNFHMPNQERNLLKFKYNNLVYHSKDSSRKFMQ